MVEFPENVVYKIFLKKLYTLCIDNDYKRCIRANDGGCAELRVYFELHRFLLKYGVFK